MAAESKDLAAGQSPVDLVRELMRILDGTSIAELEVEHGGVTVYIQREAHAAAASPTPSLEPVASRANVDGQDPDESVVTASYVGEFRRTEELPVAGDSVKTGVKLGEIEVLGIRNPVLANADGVLSALLVEDGGPVEYGQPLAIIGVGGQAPEPPASAGIPAQEPPQEPQ